MNLLEGDARYRDGRDEMNLADFPISALPRTQKSDGDGRKVDRMELDRHPVRSRLAPARAAEA